ncbi:hypothetical protein ACFVAF_04095 [Streptomyces sp. NPDC057596]|uniref:hypothetical protein n=1 Tax=Streptomyces sp. NPDC057596 TaxID=3346178 RepID=UPI0036D014BB
MSTALVRRPTEHAALRRFDRAPRRSLSVPAILADLITANRARDREAVCRLGHLMVRATAPEVGE